LEKALDSKGPRLGPLGGLGYKAEINTAFEKPKYSLYYHFLNLAVDSNAIWRTQNFTDEWWRDGEGFIELARTRRKVWRSHEICACHRSA